MDCIDLEPSRPHDLWDSNFDVMRGFFISNVPSRNAPSREKGPQLTTAIAGDKLRLDARVYNYSFASMPSNSQVHVPFYTQEVNINDEHRPIGNSILINEVTLSGIRPSATAIVTL